MEPIKTIMTRLESVQYPLFKKTIVIRQKDASPYFDLGILWP